MKWNTIMPYWQSAKLESFTVTQSPDSGVIARTFYDNGTVSLRFIAKTTGDSIVYSQKELALFERLSDIVDRAGNPVIDDTYYVKSVIPTINTMGFTDGYAYKVAKV
jgi:hypothetical protein